jgi:hypothetical protein
MVLWHGDLAINEETCSVKQIGTFATGSKYHYNIDEIINMQNLKALK